MDHINVIARDIEIVQHGHFIFSLRQISDIKNIIITIKYDIAVLIRYLDIFGDESIDLVEGTIGIPGINISRLKDVF
jgi:hypothetical protein